MNKQNLIMTPTAEMPREKWLEFRQPMTHVKKFIEEEVWPLGQKINWATTERKVLYTALKEFFLSSEKWKGFVFPTLGASEVAAIMGLNPYKSSIELYFEKIGAKPVYDQDNAAMFWGRELEEQIAEKWQYWDGT